MLNYDLLPEHLQGGMKRYVEQGIQPGHFLTAVLENDLLEAFKRADDTSTAAMRQIAQFVYDELPMQAHGSPAKMRDWMKARQAAARKAIEEQANA